MKKRWENLCKKIAFAPAVWIRNHIPEYWKAFYILRLSRYYKQTYPESNMAAQKRAELFFLRQLAGLFWGLILCLLFLVGMLAYQRFHMESILFERNAYGDGKKQESLLLKKDKNEKVFSMDINEIILSEEEMEQLFDQCMAELKEEILGDNRSFERVNHPMDFVESMAGYPFDISYFPENVELITSYGQLGEKGILNEKNKPIQTYVIIELAYMGRKREEKVYITLVPQEVDPMDALFYDTEMMLKRLESKNRMKKDIAIPSEYDGIRIEKEDSNSSSYGFLLLALFATIFLSVHSFQNVKEKALAAKYSTVRDFPDIVHYITLYMGAGLSFSSTIKRISQDYQNGAYGSGKRYAYDQIVLMDRQMDMGTSQKEACLKWGNQFQETMYQKLSMVLIQCFSKGSKEANQLLEQTRKDAFRQYIDQSRRAGEEASSKLLFPMMVLMGIVMLIIMVPAIIQFRMV